MSDRPSMGTDCGPPAFSEVESHILLWSRRPGGRARSSPAAGIFPSLRRTFRAIPACPEPEQGQLCDPTPPCDRRDQFDACGVKRFFGPAGPDCHVQRATVRRVNAPPWKLANATPEYGLAAYVYTVTTRALRAWRLVWVRPNRLQLRRYLERGSLRRREAVRHMGRGRPRGFRRYTELQRYIGAEPVRG